MGKRRRGQKKTKAEKRAIRARKTKVKKQALAAPRRDRVPPLPPYHGPLSEVIRDLDSRGIPIDTPGFCDDPAFLEVEKTEPTYLHNYARVICSRTYTDEYLTKAETIIREVASVFHSQLKADGTPGACAYVSMQLTRVLDHLGVFNCMLSGTLRAEFPNRPNLSVHFPSLYTEADPKGISFHCWVSAPPIRVIDISVSQQKYAPGIAELMPDMILAEKPCVDIAQPADLVDAGSIRTLLMRGEDPQSALLRRTPDILNFLNTFRGSYFETPEARISYFPTAVNACIEPIDELSTLNGRTVLDIVERDIRPRLQ